MMERGRPHGRPRGQKRKRSPVQQSSKTRWAYLPVELREMILEALEDALQGGKAASYASVCKEFNNYLEPYIFKRIKLSVRRIHESEDIITQRRRQFVQFLWFRLERFVKLDATPVGFRTHMDDAAFCYGIFYLFQLLSEWEDRDEGQPGIVLELTAFSAADPDGSMKDIIPKELRDVDITEDSDSLNAMYDKYALQTMRSWSEEVRKHHIMLTPFYVSPDFSNTPAMPFPSVKVITDLTVRRQMHSSFFAKYMGPLVTALPKLEFITYEPSSALTRQWDVEGLDINAHVKAVENIIRAMPSSIRRLQVFEDDVSMYCPGYREPRSNRSALGRLVADLSQNKEPEALAMSFIIDAEDFFSDFLTPQITRSPDKLGWINLTSLVLTSSRITPWSCQSVSALLVAAARAARHMPRLEIMEIYNAEPRDIGGIFTYIHDKEGSFLCWEATWKWELPPEVIRVWQRAAKVHGKGGFDHSSSQISKQDLKWVGRIVSLLRTRVTVVHPFTYGNMVNGLNYM